MTKHGIAAWRDEMIEEVTAKAVQETEHKATLKFAGFLKANGFSAEEIAKAIGLPIDEILKL